MGKKGGKNQDNKKGAAKQQESVVESQAAQEAVAQESVPEVMLTPEEKTAQYKNMQIQVFTNFVADFEDEEKNLLMDENDPGFFAERQRDLEKREREELKRLEKQVFKKDLMDVEEAYVNGNLKQIKDRMMKSINESILKQQRVLAKIQSLFDEEQKISQKKRSDIQAILNKKNMLAKLCSGLLDKNCELYLTHERMLEEERKQRQALAANFGDQMKEVQVDLDVQKSKRQEEIEENGELRKQIQVAIDSYREKEANYRAKMDTHGKMISDLEKKLKSTIEGTVTKTIKEAEAEKAKFSRVCENVKELSSKINGFMQKFDLIKDEMSENSRKFENYQGQVETKKLEIKTLETEIENITLTEKRHQKVS